MPSVWPDDIIDGLSGAPVEAIRPFKCLLLMPFEPQFDPVAEILHDIVQETVGTLALVVPDTQFPKIDRLDWVVSSGIIQEEIWQRVALADLIFCDISGCNPNVMFESGVCAAWKGMEQVVFIRNRSSKEKVPFDIAPKRYTEYSLESDRAKLEFRLKVTKLTKAVLIAFPNLPSDEPILRSPLEITFTGNRDDLVLRTPPLAHRRVIRQALEFGSTISVNRDSAQFPWTIRGHNTDFRAGERAWGFGRYADCR